MKPVLRKIRKTKVFYDFSRALLVLKILGNLILRNFFVAKYPKRAYKTLDQIAKRISSLTQGIT